MFHGTRLWFASQGLGVQRKSAMKITRDDVATAKSILKSHRAENGTVHCGTTLTVHKGLRLLLEAAKEADILERPIKVKAGWRRLTKKEKFSCDECGLDAMTAVVERGRVLKARCGNGRCDHSRR